MHWKNIHKRVKRYSWNSESDMMEVDEDGRYVLYESHQAALAAAQERVREKDKEIERLNKRADQVCDRTMSAFERYEKSLAAVRHELSDCLVKNGELAKGVVKYKAFWNDARLTDKMRFEAEHPEYAAEYVRHK